MIQPILPASRSVFLSILLSFLFVSMLSCNSGGKQLLLSNTLDEARPDELIVLKRSDIDRQAAYVQTGKYVQLTVMDRPLVVQHDDLDGDGNWDEIAFLYSFKPKETVQVNVTVADAPATIKAVVRAHARHKRKDAADKFGEDLVKDSIPPAQPATDFSKQAYPPFLTEGPAWENDKVGFRLYFDVRNGRDIWGKTTTRMVMDEVGVDTANNYHKQAEWGMDILKVGKSLGAGALALQVKQKNGKDTLIRLGGPNIGAMFYSKIADGPVRAIIRTYYPSWLILEDHEVLHVAEEISIWGGQYFYQNKVFVEHAPADAKLVTGIVNLHSKESFRGSNTHAEWLFAYDTQTENNDQLGMALITEKKFFASAGKTADSLTDVQHTYTMALNIKNDEPSAFRFYAGWEKSDSAFKTKAGFDQYLQQQARFFSQPINIEWKKAEPAK